MLTRNHVVSVALLLAVALLFGVPGGAHAKGAGGNPPTNPIVVGPAVDGIMTFFVNGTSPTCPCFDTGCQEVSFVGSCSNVDIIATICFEWAKQESPALEETDLVARGNDTPTGNGKFGQIVKIPTNQPSLVGPLQECYNDTTTSSFFLQFQSVNDFTVLTPDQTYIADVVLKRQICPSGNQDCH